MAATVVLVHGAFHGSGYWAPTLKGLADLGINALAPDLPGRGADTRPQPDLLGDIAALTEVLDGVPGPIVLVGHSYGGAVVTGAGLHPNVEHVVVLAGYLLEEGETINTAGVVGEVEGIDHTGRPNLRDALSIEDGVATILPEPARPIFYSDFDDEQYAEILTMHSPQRLDSFNQHPGRYAQYEKKTTFLVCNQDMVIHPHIQRIMARRTTRAAAWDCGHFPMITEADKTVRFLAKIAEQV